MSYTKPSALAALLIAAALMPAARAGQQLGPAARVGDLGDPQRLAFEGNKAFTARALRDGLNSDLGFVVASHPFAPRGGFLDALRDTLVLGYRHGGFPEARVAIEVAAGAGGNAPLLVAKIAEGPRYTNGAVQIAGARVVPAERLVEWLTMARKPSRYSAALTGRPDKPIHAAWKRGKPTAFDDVSRAHIEKRVREAYAELGHFFPKLAVRIVPDEGKPTARLLVEVADEGPAGTIGDIEVTGAKKNSRESVLKYLKVAAGEKVDQRVVERLRYDLWRSGRFLSCAVKLQPPSGEGGKQSLDIRLREYGGAPPLSAKLSAAQQTLLRLRDWLAAFPHGQDDAVISSGVLGMSLELVFSPRQGFLLRVQSGEPADEWGLLLAADKLAFLTRGGGSVVARQRVRLTAYVRVLPLPEKEDNRNFELRLGLGVATRGDRDKPSALRPEFSLAPVAFLALANRDDYTCTFDQGALTVASDLLRLKIDRETGRPLEALIDTPPPAQPVRIRLQKGALDERAKALGLAAAAEASADDVWTAFAEQLASRLLAVAKITPEQRRRAIAVVRALMRLTATMIGELVPDAPPQKQARFKLPADPRRDATAALIAKAILPWASRAFPRNSWPWTLSREAAFVACRRGKYTARELARLYQSEDTGPISCLTAAWLLNFVNPRMSHAFAARGLERLALGAFLKDCRPFVQGTDKVATFIRKCVDVLCALDPDDVKAVAAILPPRKGKQLADLLGLLQRERKDKPADEALLAVLEHYWDETLRKQVRDALLRFTAR